MPSTQIWGFSRPTSYGRGVSEAFLLVPATATATAPPDGETDVVSTENTGTLRVFVAYSGTVTTCVLRLWLLQDGVWYRASDVTLDPAGGNEARDWTLLGEYTQFTVQVIEIAGGGTAEVRVLGVW